MLLIIKLIYLNTPDILNPKTITRIRLTCHELHKNEILEKLWYQKICWWYISQRHRLSPEFIDKHINFLDMEIVSRYQNPVRLMEIRNLARIDWTAISGRADLSAKFIVKYNHKLDWEELSYNPSLTRRIIKKFANRIIWRIFSRYINENYIEQFEPYINWYDVYDRNIKDKNIYKKYADKVNLHPDSAIWRRVSFYRFNPSAFGCVCPRVICYQKPISISKIILYLSKKQLGNPLTNVFLGIKDSQFQHVERNKRCARDIVRFVPSHYLRYFRGVPASTKSHHVP